LIDRKPSYSAEDNPKVINFIKPEEIAKSVLELLDVPNEIGRKSFYFGERFSSIFIESIPDCIIDPKFLPAAGLHIRYDYVPENEMTQSFLYNQLSLRKCAIVTDKILNEGALQQLKPNIAQIIIQVRDESQVAIAKQAEKIGIPYMLISELTEEEIQKLKLAYLDHAPITRRAKFTKDKLPQDKLSPETKYKVSKLLLSQSKVYTSKAHWVSGKDTQPFAENTVGEFIDSPEFWEEAEFFYLYNNGN
jgi:hypothetical protein